MAVEKQALKTANFYAPRFEIEIGGSKLAADMSKAIMDVTVEEKLDEGGSFKFTVYDEFDLKTQKFTWLDHKLFNVGNEVTIKIGYGSSLITLLMGKITALEPSFFAGGAPTLTVKGHDLSYDVMKRGSPEDPFVNKSYKDIAADIAKKAQLTLKADKTAKFKGTICKKNDESYFAFLKELAQKIGFQVWIERKNLHFKKPDDDKKEILTLTLGKDITSFCPNLNTARLISEVEVRAHNPKNPKKPIIGKAKKGSERAQEPGRQAASQLVEKCHGKQKKVITNANVKSVKEANDLAKAELDKASDGLIQGDVECIGIPQIRPGVCIKLDRMGERFSGKYYVTAAAHTVSSSGYKTSFSVKRNAL